VCELDDASVSTSLANLHSRSFCLLERLGTLSEQHDELVQRVDSLEVSSVCDHKSCLLPIFTPLRIFGLTALAYGFLLFYIVRRKLTLDNEG